MLVLRDRFASLFGCVWWMTCMTSCYSHSNWLLKYCVVVRLHVLQPQVQDWRQQAEAYVLQHLCDMPTTTIGQAGSCFKLLQSSHTFPTAGSRDLLSCAIDRKLIARFNPFLSETSATAVHEGILIWAQLCVLEDRLERLMNLFAAGVDTYKAVIIRVSMHSCIGS